MESKIELRKQIKNQKPTRSSGELSALHVNLISFLKNQHGTWSAYYSLPDEPNIQEVVQKCSHLNWCFPRVQKNELSFFKVGPKGPIKSDFGVLEPEADSQNHVSLAQISGMLIPGMAFSEQGIRLGRGKGYYDKTLKEFKNQKIGVGWNHQIYPELPEEAHDIRMDQIITPLGILYFESVR